MNKFPYIVLGFIPTLIAIIALSVLVDYIGYYYFIFISLICLTTGIKMIRTEGYKYIGIGVISALISFYLFLLLAYIALSGPI
ncbi:hypothetical protein NU09_2934 [Flavobacterium beibuense]|uniref:Uncharacterized protein n=1 Tax=Flavobacterium beibuense TaxID=657326 RepID=A0A444W6S3_9FLAO|nr:hypothetical protein NU09_2934 [Flavobacterium beibuense]